MDLLLEGILIAIMMAIILFFLVSEYSAFFAPKSSISYFNSLSSMADSACTSIQTASGVQFISPKIFVFQMYDTPACNSLLGSNQYIFSPSSASLSSLEGNYGLCYANISSPSGLGVAAGNQYFLQAPTPGTISFYLPKKYSVSGSSNMSKYAIYNEIGMPGISVNSSGPFSLILDSPGSANPLNYSFYVNQYSNRSVDVAVYFNGEASCSVSYSNLKGVHSLAVASPCQQGITNITISVGAASGATVNYQVNATAVPVSNPSSVYLAQQCSGLVPLVNEGVIDNGSIICRPIMCGGTSFYLADQNNRPFLGLYGKSYSFLGVQSGINDLQIVNSYPEQLINSSLMDETLFVESGLPAGTSWSVTYDGTSKSSLISLTGSGTIIGFSNPYGNYSFTVPNTEGTVGKIPATFYSSPSSGKTPQGSYVTVSFTST